MHSKIYRAKHGITRISNNRNIARQYGINLVEQPTGCERNRRVDQPRQIKRVVSRWHGAEVAGQAGYLKTAHQIPEQHILKAVVPDTNVGTGGIDCLFRIQSRREYTCIHIRDRGSQRKNAIGSFHEFHHPHTTEGPDIGSSIERVFLADNRFTQQCRTDWDVVLFSKSQYLIRQAQAMNLDTGNNDRRFGSREH